MTKFEVTCQEYEFIEREMPDGSWKNDAVITGEWEHEMEFDSIEDAQKWCEEADVDEDEGGLMHFVTGGWSDRDDE